MSPRDVRRSSFPATGSIPATTSPTIARAALAGPPRLTYFGIFLISAATLLLQITFMRIFSASIWYHFAFLVLSVALFGFGASGVAIAFISHERGRRLIGWAPGIFGAASVLAYFGCNAVPFSPFLVLRDAAQVFYFMLYVLFLALPCICAGMTVGLVLREWPEKASRLYAADLVGAAIGTALVFLALPLLGAPATVFLAAMIGWLAAASLSHATNRHASFVWSALAAAIIPILFLHHAVPEVRVDSTKLLATLIAPAGGGGGRNTFTAWNMLSRIDVVEHEGQDPAILIDSAAQTRIRPPRRDVQELGRDISTLVWQLRHGADVVVVGSGGGEDVQNALAFGARRVTAIEINPTIVDLVLDHYREYVGNIFSDSRVRLVRDEGRSFLQRDREHHDAIALTLIDTWAAGASGAYSLSENYLYTTDAFRVYLDHLAPHGILSITRWSHEVPRLASLAREALEAGGVEDAGARVLVLRQDYRSLFLLNHDPFTRDEVETARRLAARNGWTVQYDPFRADAEGFYGRFFAAADARSFVSSFKTELRPVSDDSPFFFQMGRWKNLHVGSLRGFEGGSFLEPLALPVGQMVLLVALGLGLVLSVLLLTIPLLRGGVPQQHRRRWLLYFGALGIGYMAVEVILMQRFALFLGHPTYAVTVVLFSLLLFSGLGSFWSDRRVGRVGRPDASPFRSGALSATRLALPIALLLVAFAVPPVVRALIGLPHLARMVIAIAMIAPVGFLMGIPFPAGMRAAAASNPAYVAWGWAANGCGSVIGSSCAVLGAMLFSFSAVLVVTAVLYAGVLWGPIGVGRGIGE